MGAEDLTVATKWNLLIGKTLNNKYGCPWLTRMLNSVSGDNYHYEEFSKLEKRMNYISHTENQVTLECSTVHGKPENNSNYTLVASNKMVGVFISVWIRQEFLRKYCISNVKICSVACGVMGYLGNKGSVAVSMLIEGTSICFVVAHLASGEKKGDEARRNRQVLEIFRRTCFPGTSKDDRHPRPLTIFDHE